MHDQRTDEHWGGNWAYFEKRKSRGRVWIGFLLLIAGVLLFLRSAGLLILPYWLFTWPVFLIAIGLVTGISERFRGGFWIAAMFLGGLFLANEIDPSLQVGRFIAPIVVFTLGLLFVFSPKRRRWKNAFGSEAWPAPTISEEAQKATAAAPEPLLSNDRRDYIDITAVFGAVKKNVLTKNFKGGDITCFMGGAELNLTQADINGEVRIDLTNVFGGTKLIVPPTWTIHSDTVTIFGGVDDKRLINGTPQDPGKTLVLDGTCLFGGIEIRSF